MILIIITLVLQHVIPTSVFEIPNNLKRIFDYLCPLFLSIYFENQMAHFKIFFLLYIFLLFLKDLSKLNK